MSDDALPASVVYERGGYTFRIDVRFLPYPWAAFQYWAKVTGATRSDTGAALTIDQLPFRPLQHHGATEADALAQAKRQIDEALTSG